MRFLDMFIAIAACFRITHAFPSLSHREMARPANLTFFGVWLGADSQSGTLLDFQSTFIIPSPPRDATTNGHVVAFWPGMEPASSGGVLQNVVTNQGGGPGEWYLLPFYCCEPVQGLTAPMRIYPGDSVSSHFSLDASTGHWYDSWVVSPGNIGSAAGAKSFGGGLLFDPTIDSSTYGTPYTNTLMTIELQGLGTWDFGLLQWKNIVVTANTTDTEWCTNGPALKGGQDFKKSWSSPTWTTNAGVTTCYIGYMVFEGANS